MLVVVMFASVWVLGAGSDVADPDYRDINAEIINNHIRPGYEAFDIKARNLGDAITRLCHKADDRSLGAAHTAFHEAIDAWQAVEHLRFGAAQHLSAHARLNFWPDKRGRVGKHLRRLLSAKDPTTALQPAAFAGGSVAVQGFPAMERVLFAGGAPADLKVPSGALSPCDVLGAISVNIAGIADELVTAWRKAPVEVESAGVVANRMIDRLINEVVAMLTWSEYTAPYSPNKKASVELLGSLSGGLHAVVDLKLGGPLGKNAGRTHPKRAENWRSARAHRNIEINLSALRDLYVRLAEGAGVRLAGTAEDRSIRAAFDQGIAEAQALGPSLQSAVDKDQGGCG